jgi:flagellar hook-basal body complex protein FliE
MNFAREKTRKVIVEENYVIDITIVIRKTKVSIKINKKIRKKGFFA